MIVPVFDGVGEWGAWRAIAGNLEGEERRIGFRRQSRLWHGDDFLLNPADDYDAVRVIQGSWRSTVGQLGVSKSGYLLFHPQGLLRPFDAWLMNPSAAFEAVGLDHTYEPWEEALTDRWVLTFPNGLGVEIAARSDLPDQTCTISVSNDGVGAICEFDLETIPRRGDKLTPIEAIDLLHRVAHWESQEQTRRWFMGVFGITDADLDAVGDDPFGALKGCMAEYGGPDFDSVEAVRAVRDRFSEDVGFSDDDDDGPVDEEP